MRVFRRFYRAHVDVLKSRHIPPFNIASINRAPSTIRDVIDPEIARLRFISLVSLFLSQRSSIFGDAK